jgi:uncharacterized protein (DUF2141 family)
MKTVLFFFLTMILLSFTSEKNGRIVITISGLDLKKKGNVVIGIFKKENFPIESKSSYNKIIPVTDSKMEVIFPNVDADQYGIAIFQDKDKSGKLSTNLIGIPNEPFGFSNNKFGTFGPPEFTEIAVKVSSKSSTEVNIKLKYVSFSPF